MELRLIPHAVDIPQPACELHKVYIAVDIPHAVDTATNL